MDIRAFVTQMGLPIGDIRDSIAYEDEMLEVEAKAKADGKVEEKIDNGLAFLQETSMKVSEIIRILKMDEQVAVEFRKRASEAGFDPTL